MSSALEAKLVVLGAQGESTVARYPRWRLCGLIMTTIVPIGVGKTSLLHRYIHNTFSPNTPSQSTLGASFLTKRLQEHASDTEVRLQIWDTAGQERFRSISRLYYRGAHAAILCYDITDERSWEEMKGWLSELREQCGGIGAAGGEGIIVHVVGTKSDIVAEDPSTRKVPFERTIAYVADQLGPSQASTPPATSHQQGGHGHAHSNSHSQSLLAALNPSSTPVPLQSPDSKRSSGFWGSDVAWDSCHEVSSRDGEGIEEVFRVIARKLVEQKNRRVEREMAMNSTTPGLQGRPNEAGYFDGVGAAAGAGSFRVGHGDKRRSWLGLPSHLVSESVSGEERVEGRKSKAKCC